MHLGTQLRSPSRLATRLVLLLALAVASLTLTQCRMVGDKLTGVQASSLHRGNRCLKRCREEYRDERQDEKERHKRRLRNCERVPACIAAENQRYAAALAAIEAAYTACRNGCHDQGGGGDD